VGDNLSHPIADSKGDSLIIIDTSELSEGSRLATIPDSTSSTKLESISGADILITPLSIPATSRKLLEVHANAGALFVQRKSGEDLVRSIGERINSSLARMVSLNTRQFQRILISTGYYAPKFDNVNCTYVGTLKSDAEKGKPYIWWRDAPMPYMALQTTLRHFAYRGGVYIPLSCDDELPVWCKRAEEEIIAFHNGEQDIIKQVWPSAKDYPPDDPLPNDPLQEPVLVKDDRLILVGFDGIGAVTANAIWENAIGWLKRVNPSGPEYLWVPDLMLLLNILVCDTEEWIPPMHIKGLGKKRRENIRLQLGLPPGTELGHHVVNLDDYQNEKLWNEWMEKYKEHIEGR